MAGGDLRATPLAGTPAVPSPPVTRLCLCLQDRLLWEVPVLLLVAQDVVKSPSKKAVLGARFAQIIDARCTWSRRKGVCSLLPTHLGTKMSPNGHLLLLPRHEG